MRMSTSYKNNVLNIFRVPVEDVEHKEEDKTIYKIILNVSSVLNTRRFCIVKIGAYPMTKEGLQKALNDGAIEKAAKKGEEVPIIKVIVMDRIPPKRKDSSIFFHTEIEVFYLEGSPKYIKARTEYKTLTQ